MSTDLEHVDSATLATLGLIERAIASAGTVEDALDVKARIAAAKAQAQAYKIIKRHRLDLLRFCRQNPVFNVTVLGLGDLPRIRSLARRILLIDVDLEDPAKLLALKPVTDATPAALRLKSSSVPASRPPAPPRFWATPKPRPWKCWWKS